MFYLDFVGIIAQFPCYASVSMLKLLIASCVMALEAVVVGRRKCSIRRLIFDRSPSSRKDIALFVVQMCGAVPLLAAISLFGLPLLTDAFVSWSHVNQLRINTGYFVGDLSLFLLFWSLGDYWRHRLLHTSKFWPLHRLHHSAEEMNVIASIRQHPGSYWLRTFTTGLLPALFLMPVWFALMFGTFIMTWGYLTHADLPWTFGWIGRWVLVSPAAHRLHHSLLPEHGNKNFSGTFIWCDRVFGTYMKPTSERPPVGTDDDKASGLVGELVDDSIRFVSWTG